MVVQERGKLLPPGRSFQLRQRDPRERRPEGSAAGVKFLVIQATETVRLEGGLIRDTVSRAGQSRPQKNTHSAMRTQEFAGRLLSAAEDTRWFDSLRRGGIRLVRVEEKRPLRRQPDDLHFWSLIMLAVTIGAFLLVTWVATKALFFFLQEAPIP